MTKYYFGRGSGVCVGVEFRENEPYCRVFMGNEKHRQRSDWMLLDKTLLHQLGDFFHALGYEHGQDLYVERLTSDPCDEVFVHDFDLEAKENG